MLGVVIPVLEDLQVIADHAVDESVLFGDPPRPGVGPVFQRLRLADASTAKTGWDLRWA
jgi:hypothetical protein